MTTIDASTKTVTPEDLNKAVASLGYRLSELEQAKSANVGADGSDASKLRITLANTLRDLKSLHVAMQMGVNEIEEKLKTTVELEAETKKMNYRILHLKKSVKESES